MNQSSDLGIDSTILFSFSMSSLWSFAFKRIFLRSEVCYLLKKFAHLAKI